jgi:predicted ATPase
MRLTQIEIENFKGVGEKQTLDLAPITLLFGPNSAGKSTILQALQYVRAILEGENPDPDPYVDSGDVDYGGFKNLVHGHDLSKEICIGLTIDLTDDGGSSLLKYSLGDAIDERQFRDLQIQYLAGGSEQIQSVGVELFIKWNEREQVPYVSQICPSINGSPTGYLLPIQGRLDSGLTKIDWMNIIFHPLLQPVSEYGTELEPDEALKARLSSDEWDQYIDDKIEDFDYAANPIWLALTDLTVGAFPCFIQNSQPRSYSGLPGALPNLDSSLVFSWEFHDEGLQPVMAEGDGLLLGGIQSLLTDLILSPIQIVRAHLRSLVHIGPLRDFPDRTYQPTRRLSPWFRGRAAWDLLYDGNSNDLLENVNQWISGEDRLDTGYEIVDRAVREVPLPSAFDQFFERNLEEDDLPQLQELYSSLKVVREISLRDLKNNIDVSPLDVGVGVSQLIPVVVACCADRLGLIAVEQPELHIHPRVQVGLGDLLIDTTGENSQKSVLMETHSEHMLLRLLRRIAETTDGELPPDVNGLDCFDLSVIYVHSTDEGVQFKKLRVNPDGEFRDRWPEGFFGERSEELF